jgi:hypothetical protein
MADMSRLRTHLLLAVAAVLVLGLGGCAEDSSPADRAGDRETTSTPDSEPGGTLALTADGSATAKCAVPSAQILRTFDTAFAGTVTSVDDGTATLSVDEWYAGDEAATVTVTAPSKDLQDLLMAVDFEEGRSYLVSATRGRVTLCGFTAETSPRLQGLYDEAFTG